jgi:hypothetical protein
VREKRSERTKHVIGIQTVKCMNQASRHSIDSYEIIYQYE